jgi:NitT/TauT family transport system substrate-binding protein
MHIEQAAEIRTRGNFQILVRPWTEYADWFSAVVMARDSWLKSGDNAKSAVAVLTAVLTAFRRSNDDYAWWKAQVAKYASSKDTRNADDAFLKPVWQSLTTEIKAFPPNMEQLTPETFAAIVPVYQKAGVLKGTLDLHKVIDRAYLEQAIKGLA